MMTVKQVLAALLTVEKAYVHTHFNDNHGAYFEIPKGCVEFKLRNLSGDQEIHAETTTDRLWIGV